MALLIYHMIFLKRQKNRKANFLSTRGIEIFRDAIQLILTLITEIIIVIGIFIFLFIINPKIFLTVTGIIIPMFFLFHWINKKNNLIWGRSSKNYDKQIIKNLYDSFNFIKEIKIRYVENFFFHTT